MPSVPDGNQVLLVAGALLAVLVLGALAAAFGLLPADDGHGEPNDAFTSATSVEAGTYPDRQLDAGEYDFYAVSLDAGESATAELEFAHADGDLDLEAYDPQGRILARSESITDGERVEVDADEPGRYYLLVYGHEDAENEYDLLVDVGRSNG